MPASTSGRRLGVLGGIALVLLAIVATRTWFLQVVDASDLETKVAEVMDFAKQSGMPLKLTAEPE